VVVRGRGENSGDRLNQWAATRLVGCFGGVKLTRGPCTLCALLARVCRTMQLAPFRCAGGRCRPFIDRALASDCSNLTTHAIPDTRETNNHWTSCQPLSLHGLGQGSGSLSVRDKERNIARWSQGPAYLSRSDLQEVPSLQSFLETLWFNTTYLTHSHISRGAQRTQKLTPALTVIRSVMLVSPEPCLLACLVARVAQRTAT
jgi:hypothetical protein